MRTAQLHSSSYLSFIFVSKEGVSQSTGRVDGWGAGQCGVGLSSAGMEGSEGRVDGGPSRLLKPKYSVPFQDLSLGRTKPPFQNLRRQIHSNIYRRALISFFSRFSLAKRLYL